jgi:hypothetical protein
MAPATLPLPRSGSRLRVVWWEGADGAKQFNVMHDLTRNVDCQAQQDVPASNYRCVPAMNPGPDMSVYAVLHTERESISNDLGVEYWAGDDGSRWFSSWTLQQDFASGENCAFGSDLNPDRCAPVSPNYLVSPNPYHHYFTDSNCSQSTDLFPNARLIWLQDPSPPRLVFTEALPNAVMYMTTNPIDFPVTPPCDVVMGASRPILDVTCALVPGAPSGAYSGTRLSGLPPSFANHLSWPRWLDSSRGEACGLSLDAADGTMRCLPEGKSIDDVVYYDPSCVTMAILPIDPAQVAAMPNAIYYAITADPGIRPLRAGAPITVLSGPVYKKVYTAEVSGCFESAPPVGPLFEGVEVPPSEFVEFTRLVE